PAPIRANDIVDEQSIHNFILNDVQDDAMVYTQMTGNLNTIPSIEDEHQTTINMYPNPAGESVTLSGLIPSGRFEVVNVLGQTLLQKNITSQTYIVNLSEMKPGIYYVQFYNSEGTKIESKKLIVE
ncbi:MAG TPA: T9SS type A sorting domain-containing protein, partial [Bacteroidia bacterium]|nr:T9SS type A sorting domain-containing protein [Bacteroidia bacterium]